MPRDGLRPMWAGPPRPARGRDAPPTGVATPWRYCFVGILWLLCSCSSETPGVPPSSGAAKPPLAPLPAAEQARLRALFDEKDQEAANSLGMRFRLIFPGTFTSRAGTTAIKWPFYLGACEVTQAQYEKVTGENPSHFRGANLPADSINWDEALAFCRRLSEVEGAEYRLPTEAEWDYACRAGATTRLCWGDSPDAIGLHAWVRGNSGEQSHPVGLKRPNAWGLYDMHGNVWEWCQVVPGGYTAGNGDRALPGTLRGGSWAEAEAGHCGLLHSFGSVPGNRLVTNGFRVVRSLP